MPQLGSSVSVPAHGSTSPGCESGWSHKYLIFLIFGFVIVAVYFVMACPFISVSVKHMLVSLERY